MPVSTAFAIPSAAARLNISRVAENSLLSIPLVPFLPYFLLYIFLSAAATTSSDIEMPLATSLSERAGVYSSSSVFHSAESMPRFPGRDRKNRANQPDF